MYTVETRRWFIIAAAEQKQPFAFAGHKAPVVGDNTNQRL
jgi:hypothetical protein